MRTDHRPADGQAHSHAATFGGEEGIEDLLALVCVNSGAVVLEADLDMSVLHR
ncbi:hypothetical protein D3C72_2335000 [compost metagenome]